MRTTDAARLQKGIVAYAIAAMVALSVAVAAACVVPLQRHTVAAADQNLSHSLDQQVKAIGEALARLRDLTRQITSRTVIRDALVQYNDGAMTRDALHAFSADKLADALRLAPEMLGIVRLDRSGRVVVTVGEVPAPDTAVPAAEDGPAVGDLIMAPDGRARVAVAAPIFGRTGRREGTDVVLFDGAAIEALVTEEHHLGRTWVSHLMVEDGAGGYGALIPRGAAVAGVAGLRSALDAARDAPSLVHAVTEEGGDAVVLTAQRVPGTAWMLAVRIHANELYYDSNRLVLSVGGTAVGLTLLGTLGMFLVLRPLTGRMLVHADDLARQLDEQRRTVAALSRLQRTLKTLSGGNQALIHATAEPDLLDEMCRIVVEVGGYPQAWVALVEEGTVRLAAQRGDGVLPEAEAAALGGPIRAGLMLHREDRAADPALAALPGVEAPRGLLLLPLPDRDGAPLGAIAIHGRDAAGFDMEERALLSEMAGDLAYGIVTLRTRIRWQADEERLERALEKTIQAVAATVEIRDPSTAGHQRRVAELAAGIARALGLADDRVKGVYVAGIIHDIGKVAVPAEIFSRPGRLNALEFELVKEHPTAGADIIGGVEFPWPVAAAIAQHHERLDGSGYPAGLSGDAIRLEARILAVADVVEAMTAHRPYRPALSVAEALAEIRAHRGTLYDAAVVDACIRVLENGVVRLETA
ncbi:MAG TPA: HD domain-containing phosphohydrolase [Azospirillum sp.]|nr:HD domain-containing phosphohydrolase [Azospirillum sp.]